MDYESRLVVRPVISDIAGENGILPFGVSQFSTQPLSFEEDLSLYTACGIRHVEVCEGKMNEDDQDGQIHALLESGLSVESIQPRLHSVFPLATQPEPRESRARIAAFRKTIERFAPHFPGVTFITVTGQAPGGNYKEAYAIAGQFYRELGVVASANGVRIALEPLNPILMNVDTFICSLAHARELIEEADSSSFGICIDTWHIWQDPHAEMLLKELAGRVFVVHINDWTTPRSFNDRRLPAQGIIPLKTWLRRIRDSGYTGTYFLEIFSDLSLENSLWKTPRLTIETARDNFAEIWRQL